MNVPKKIMNVLIFLLLKTDLEAKKYCITKPETTPMVLAYTGLTTLSKA